MTKSVKRKRVTGAAEGIKSRKTAKKAKVAMKIAAHGPEPDPIFGAIEAHKAACAAYEKPRKVTAHMRGNHPRYDAAEAVERRAADHEMRTLQALLKCSPTTLLGVIAVLEHVSKPEWLTSGPRKGTGQTILSGLCEYSNDKADAARWFPLRLAVALRDIVGPERWLHSAPAVTHPRGIART
jgi:hypothetical protein